MKRPFRSRPEPHHLADDYDDDGLDTVGLASGALGRSAVGDPADYVDPAGYVDPADYVDPAGYDQPVGHHDPGPGGGYEEQGYHGGGYDQGGYRESGYPDPSRMGPVHAEPDPAAYEGYESYESYQDDDVDPAYTGEQPAVGVLGRLRSRSGRSPRSGAGPRGAGPGGRRPGLPRSARALSGRLRGRRDVMAELPPTGEHAAVNADLFSEGMERYRSQEVGGDQRSAWAYLGLLGVMFVLLSGFGWACSDSAAVDGSVDLAGEGGAAMEPARLVVRIEGDTVTLQGAVPDEGAHTQLVQVATGLYGDGNVVDELEIDPATSFEAGTARFAGTAVFDDNRPGQLRDQIVEQFGLENRGFDIEQVEVVLSPVDATVELASGTVTASGVVPDEQSVADLTALLTETFPDATVDTSGLTVGPSTWTEGRIALTGTVGASDDRVAAFMAGAPDRLGTLITVDVTGLPVADAPGVISQVQTEVADLVAAEPIQFAPNADQIEEGSGETLVRVAELLNQVPTAAVEVVGHTDDEGDDELNQTLSEDRAAAVVARLVELGVAEGRLSSRGEGEANPIADNTTDEGRAANRRIEFRLAGAAGG